MGEIRYSNECIAGKEIIIREFFGEMNIDEMLASFKYIADNLITDKSIGIITDTSNATIKLKLTELPRVFSFLIRNKKIRRLKLAIIINTPAKAIYPILAKNKLPLMNIQSFSGKKAAIRWMLE